MRAFACAAALACLHAVMISLGLREVLPGLAGKPSAPAAAVLDAGLLLPCCPTPGAVATDRFTAEMLLGCGSLLVAACAALLAAERRDECDNRETMLAAWLRPAATHHNQNVVSRPVKCVPEKSEKCALNCC
jgi:hypothetical protein